MSEQPSEQAVQMAADIIEAEFGNCTDADFSIGCAGCLASHLVRLIRDEPTPVADAAFQRAMANEETGHV